MEVPLPRSSRLAPAHPILCPWLRPAIWHFVPMKPARGAQLAELCCPAMKNSPGGQFTAGLAWPRPCSPPPSSCRPLLELPVPALARRLAPVEQHLVPGIRVLRDAGRRLWSCCLCPPPRRRPGGLRLQETRRRPGRRAPRLRGRAASGRGAPSLLGGRSLRHGRVGPAVLPALRPAQAQRAIPVDIRASAAHGREIRVVEDASRFPSDPEELVLEHNDVAVLLRSDSLAAIDDAHSRLFDSRAGLIRLTSIRNGFLGGGLTSRTSLPKAMAMRAHIRGASHIPRKAELFLGFTSTARDALGPGRIANLETLGYARLDDPYFAGGTHMQPLASLRGRERLVPELRPRRPGRRDVPVGTRCRATRRPVGRPAPDPDHRVVALGLPAPRP